MNCSITVLFTSTRITLLRATVSLYLILLIQAFGAKVTLHYDCHCGALYWGIIILLTDFKFSPPHTHTPKSASVDLCNQMNSKLMLGNHSAGSRFPYT